LFFVDEIATEKALADGASHEDALREAFRSGLAAGLIKERLASTGTAGCEMCEATFGDLATASARLAVFGTDDDDEILVCSLCLEH
jgi:hypothetical protein